MYFSEAYQKLFIEFNYIAMTLNEQKLDHWFHEMLLVPSLQIINYEGSTKQSKHFLRKKALLFI